MLILDDYDRFLMKDPDYSSDQGITVVDLRKPQRRANGPCLFDVRELEQMRQCFPCVVLIGDSSEEAAKRVPQELRDYVQSHATTIFAVPSK